MRFQFKVNLHLSLLLAVSLVLSACGEDPSSEPAAAMADLVLLNGGIYTVNADRAWAQAAAVRDGLIVAVGSNEEIQALVGDSTPVIDLDGGMALPGFHDAHVHPTMGGYALLGCSVENATTIEDIISKVTDCAAKTGEDWLVGHAFDLGLFGQNGPHKSLLDAIETDRPIVLLGSDGHNDWVNSRALELAEISAETPDPPLGVIKRDPDGSPSGTLRETARDLVTALLPVPTLKSNVEALKAGIAHLNSLGITSYIDAWVGLEDYQSYRPLIRPGG